MEKTTTIFIAGATFTLTESAHDKLATYLSSLKTHFEGDQNCDEIMGDIEARIAEKLMTKSERMILGSDVEAIISEIGDPSQLEDQDGPTEAVGEMPNDNRGYKKLYRDMDDAWIGGVASGIATYFDINPLWVRAIFILSTIFWGASILVYIILWILVPEAKSASQKLEMRGVPVSIHTISDMFAKRADEVRKAGTIKKFFTTLTNFFKRIFRTFGKAFGILLAFGSIFAIIGTTIVFGAIFTNWNSSFNDFPLKEVVSDNLIFLSMAVTYSVIILPLILFALSGIQLVKKRVMMPSFVVITIIGVWLLSIIALGIIGSNVARHYGETIANHPNYQIETRNLNLEAFTQIVHNDDNSDVIIKSGPEQSISIRARAMEQNDVNIGVSDGILNIERMVTDKNCFFCTSAGARITITTPDLEKVSLNRSYINFEDYTDNELELNIISSSIRGKLTVPTLTINAERGNTYASINTENLMVNAKNSYFRLDGSANTAKLILENTTFGSELFLVDLAETTAIDSDVTATILEEVATNVSDMEVDEINVQQLQS